jgi:hypothetical protein
MVLILLVICSTSISNIGGWITIIIDGPKISNLDIIFSGLNSILPFGLFDIGSHSLALAFQNKI